LSAGDFSLGKLVGRGRPQKARARCCGQVLPAMLFFFLCVWGRLPDTNPGNGGPDVSRSHNGHDLTICEEASLLRSQVIRPKNLLLREPLVCRSEGTKGRGRFDHTKGERKVPPLRKCVAATSVQRLAVFLFAGQGRVAVAIRDSSQQKGTKGPSMKAGP